MVKMVWRFSLLLKNLHFNENKSSFRYIYCAAFSGGSYLAYNFFIEGRSIRNPGIYVAECLDLHTKETEKWLLPPQRSDLPFYSSEEIAEHGRNADRIWVTFKNGVYDVTNFVEIHPGGEKLLLAAGKSIEPFWSIYAQHKTPEVLQILEELRIGNLTEKAISEISIKSGREADDPFSSEPLRHPALIVNSLKPFNAETPSVLVMDNFRTPNQIFFVRNHMPTPDLDEKTHKVVIESGNMKPISLTIGDLKSKYDQVSIDSTVQCAGNRRNDMNTFKKVQGLMWTGTAIGNAKWTGCRLRDVLIAAGIDPNHSHYKHVHFEGADSFENTNYGASISFQKAMKPEVILAFLMNDEPLPRDHGYPIRLIAPGIVGARQVKWLTKIVLSEEESLSHWQQKDYKLAPSHIQIGDPIPYEKYQAIQEYPIQSAICVPAPNTKIKRDWETFKIGGYAWSGGGRGIIRVDVSCDGGNSWQSAELKQCGEQDLDHMWAWTLWEIELPIPKDQAKIDLMCRATDRAYNTQPENAESVWNVRGLLCNSWHRISVEID